MDRVLGDLERGARSNYSSQTLAATESYYGLPMGTIAQIRSQNSRASLRAAALVGADLKQYTEQQLAAILGMLAQELASRSRAG